MGQLLAGIILGSSFFGASGWRANKRSFRPIRLTGRCSRLSRRPVLTHSTRAVSKYGDWPQLAQLGAIRCLVAWKFRSRDWMKILAAGVTASTIADIMGSSQNLF
jgi:hypothetical protein